MSSKEARAFIRKKIKKNLAEGKNQKQAEAIAFNQARKQGYNVPLPGHVRKLERSR